MVITFQEGDESYHESTICTSEMQKKVRAWVEHQDSQKILLTTPVVLIGTRLEVYRVQGTTQWYTAFIHTVNETSKVCNNNHDYDGNDGDYDNDGYF